jgi:hypothetical protein
MSEFEELARKKEGEAKSVWDLWGRFKSGRVMRDTPQFFSCSLSSLIEVHKSCTRILQITSNDDLYEARERARFFF